MKTAKQTTLLTLAACGLALLSACGGGGGGGGGNPNTNTGPAVGSAVTNPAAAPYIVGWGQSIPLFSGPTGTEKYGAFPGQANIWDLGMDFGLVSGGDNQFDYALAMEVVTDATASVFPIDQSYGELSFMTPLVGAADGVKAAAVSDGDDLYNDGTSLPYSALTGTYSAFLNSTSGSRLEQSLDLSTATGAITASWTDVINTCDGGTSMVNIPGYTPSYRVVAREANGTEHELFSVSTATANSAGTGRSADLTSLAGKKIVLSFEQKSMHESYRTCVTEIDGVSVKDSAASPKEFVLNGGFETGDLGHWTVSAPSESQNVTSGTRNLVGSLNVKRSFYTAPDKLWGRWVDTFENSLASAVTATVHYQSSLGSNGCGIIYSNSTTTAQAVTSWDGSAYGRDIGWVFGNKATVSYVSDDTHDCATGSPFVDVMYSVTVPAKGKLAIVNFIILDGTDTGALSTTVDTTARATEIDTERDKILNNFWSDNQYRTGMTAEQIGAIHNF